MAKVERVPVASLVLDYTLYPRHHVNDENVRRIMEALRAGVALPAVIADKASKRVADGFHRTIAIQRVGDEQSEIAVEWRAYADNASLLADAISLNAGHGYPLSSWDQARCILLGEEAGLDRPAIAAALHITPDRVDEIKLRKTAISPDTGLTPIKNTLRPFAGKQLTADHMEANKRASGMSPVFYLNQIINLLERDAWDKGDVRIRERLERLYALLREAIAEAA